MKTVHRMKKATIALLFGFACLLPMLSLATSVVGGSLAVQNNGNVIATFQGSNAGYISSLYLGDTKIFTSNQANGSTFDLGNFTAGTQLQFRLEVHNTGQTFFTGNGANNADGLAHAVINDSFGQSETLVSFEDLLGGGDRDYNDLIFSFSNTNTELETNTGFAQNPEPSTVILLGSGMVGLAAWRWRKSQSRRE
ncbi:DUF4114 domain-containing protein [Nitrospira sp. M1]